MEPLLTISVGLTIGCCLYLCYIPFTSTKTTLVSYFARLGFISFSGLIIAALFYFLPTPPYYEEGLVHVCAAGGRHHMCFWADVWLLSLVSLAFTALFLSTTKGIRSRRKITLASAFFFLASALYGVTYYDPNKINRDDKNQMVFGFAKCWKLTEATRNSGMPIVKVNLVINKDRSLQSVQVIDLEKGRYKTDTAYKKAADYAINALKACSPLTFLPIHKYESWKVLDLVFDPSPGYDS